MNNRDKMSIKTKIVRFILVIFILVLSVIIISYTQSYLSYKIYRSTFNNYNDLEQFYNECELMNASMKNYIYSNNHKEFDNYLEHSENTHLIITRLRNSYNSKFSFRFGLLENMIQTYSEKVNKIIGLNNEYLPQDDYDTVDRLNQLIQETNQEFTKILTKQMKQDQELVYRSGRLNLFISIFIFFILLIILGIFSVTSVRGITGPIEVMIKNIQLIKNGQFIIKNISSNNSEINILITAFEDMAENLHDYIKKIKEKSKIEQQLITQENDNLKMTRLLSETKLLVLQGQMNPHFLFNTLSMISKLAYIEGAHKTSELMVSTANLLRYSMEMCTKKSNLALEINCVKNYFDIQRRRVGGRISFSIQHTEEFDNIIIPGMILQPIIENCVVHGLKDKIRNGIVDIEIWRNNDRIIISIEDNGIGVDEELLNKLNNIGYISSKKGSLGLSNIKERLKLFYSSDYLFVIDSNPECGTVIMLDIPVTYV
ncbi:MAG: histidine kinase [Spirochaetaceae bacterium]